MTIEQIKEELLNNIDDIARALHKKKDVTLKEFKGVNIYVTEYTKINNK